jgi:hypothetical protein
VPDLPNTVFSSNKRSPRIFGLKEMSGPDEVQYAGIYELQRAKLFV